MFDAYALKARVAPIVAAGIPTLLLVGASVFDLSATGSAIGLVVGACGIVACGMVRGQGLRVQPVLWAAWGGPPTTRKLRWVGNAPGAIARRHHQVEVVTGETLPTGSEEEADPQGADLKYADAVEVLRQKTRGPEFAPIASENAEYGFRRNCLGIRRFAIAASLIVAVTSMVLAITNGSGRYWIDAIIGLAAAVGWWKFVTPAWVRTSAELYADRLFQAAAGLAAQ